MELRMVLMYLMRIMNWIRCRLLQHQLDDV
jgi:hypothetical protein